MAYVEECDICGEPAKWKLRDFGIVCKICKPEVMEDLKLDDEEDVKRL
jgi:hypothetical protein